MSSEDEQAAGGVEDESSTLKAATVRRVKDGEGSEAGWLDITD